MQGIEEGIRNEGWAPISFDMDATSREEFMRLGHDVIVLAANNPIFAGALEFELDPNINIGNNNPTYYGISAARNSQDDKIWLHTGHMSRERFRRRAPGLIGTPEISNYFDAHYEVLLAMEKAFKSTLTELSDQPDNIRENFFPDDKEQRALIIRTVRYLNLDKAEYGKEVIEGHGDMSLATIQFVESHSSYLHGAAMEASMIRWDVEPDRLDYIRSLYDQMVPVEYDVNKEAAFLFGCGIGGLNHPVLNTGLNKDYPALYHAGFRPEANTPKFDNGWMQPNERMAVIGFLHPRLSTLQHPFFYRIPDVTTCRPLKAA